MPSVGRWQVLSGYNTATHTGEDPYALDIVRLDGPTAGSPVLAPIAGTIRFAGSSSGCIGIEDEHGYTTHVCHVFAAAGLDRRDRVEVGQAIGTVAPDGAANNNGIAHIHVAVFGPNGVTIPYTGEYTMDGVSFPATTAYNAYYGTVITSRNGSSGGGTSTGGNSEAFTVDVGDDFVVQPGAAVTLTASADTSDPVLEYEWHQLSGTPVQLGDSGRTVSFVAPNEPGASLIFRVIVLSTFQNTGSDSIVIQVDPDAAPAPSPPSSGGSGEIVGGAVPASGFGLIVWGGGSSEALLAASGCSAASARFWATSGGSFLTYIPGSQVAAVNAAWESRFGGGIPELTPLLARCH